MADPRFAIIALIGPIATICFGAILLIALEISATRRGTSILRIRGARSWVIAVQVVVAGGLVSGVLVNGLLTPYNFPLDWTPILIYGPIATALGLLLFRAARRELLRGLPHTQKGL